MSEPTTTAPALNVEALRAQLLALQDSALGVLRGVQAAIAQLPPAEEPREARARRKPVASGLPADLHD